MQSPKYPTVWMSSPCPTLAELWNCRIWSPMRTVFYRVTISASWGIINSPVLCETSSIWFSCAHPMNYNERSWISYRSWHFYLQEIGKLSIFLSYAKWPILKFRFFSQTAISYSAFIICKFPSSTIIIHSIEFIFYIRPTLMLGLSHSQNAAYGASSIEGTVKPS